MLTSGWFNAVVWAKVRVIMRDKIAALTRGLQPDDTEYAPLLEMPNTIKGLAQPQTDRERHYSDLSQKQSRLMQEVRTEARRPTILHQAEEDEEEGTELRSRSITSTPGVGTIVTPMAEEA